MTGPNAPESPAVGGNAPSSAWQANWGHASSTPDREGEPPSGSPQSAPEVQLPKISLPTGGGAIRAIDEKLTINQATGSASMTVPVYVSPGRQGLTPAFGLSYDSGGGSGVLGIGWRLSTPQITRKTSRGLPRYEDASDSDVYVLSDAEDLVPSLSESGEGDWQTDAYSTSSEGLTFAVRRYRPRVESRFARVERWQETTSGEVHWRTVSPQNVTNIYGRAPACRISDPSEPLRVFSWLLELSFDDRGNAVSYEYKQEDTSNVPSAAHELGRQVGANRYLKRVFYGNETPYFPATSTRPPEQWCFQLVVDYGEHDQEDPQPSEERTWPCRVDPFSSYRPGFELRTYRLCQRLLMFHQFPEELSPSPVLVRSTDLTYTTSADPGSQLPAYSLLSSVTSTGWRQAQTGGGYETAQLPALELEYSPLTLEQTQGVCDREALENVVGDAGKRSRWVDLNSEGLHGILTEDDRAWYFKRNLSAWSPPGSEGGARFAPLEELAQKPSKTSDGALQLTDLNGDGQLAAVSFAPPAPGWYEYEPESGWSPFKPMAATAALDWSSAELRMVDLDGDGLADVLLSEDEVFTWYDWSVDVGLGPPQSVRKPFDEDSGPALVFADGTGSVYLADMSGDGLSDLVRIRNGEVCYWPNLGFGRFGAKITMDEAPVFDSPDNFDERRLRLADVDGSGTADLIYFSSQGATLWFNQSGNSWSAGNALGQFPQLDDVADVNVLDLLGSGMSCLVWSSPLPGDTTTPLRYLDLTGSNKPYLLTAVANNLGATTTLSYCPSTRFYVQDLLEGTPWITRLPFPVHVVEKVTLEEAITRTSLVTSYTYHHGYYDGVEREFRGFARVEQLDAASVPVQSGTGTFTSTPVSEDGEFVLAPVRTKTWYHTGAWLDAEDLATRLSYEYSQLDPQAVQLAPTVFPERADAVETREACRALRGRILRQEIYALDGSEQVGAPYSASEHRYQVKRLQPTVSSPAAPTSALPLAHTYGCFYGYELESLAYHYERKPADPRIAHALTLEVDEYGNVTKSAAAGYGRRIPAFPEQGRTLVTYTEHEVLNVADEQDWYRLGLPLETRSFELTGIAAATPGPLLEPASLLDAAQKAEEIPYQQAPTLTSAQKRPIEHTRTLYLKNDLSGPLARGEVQSLALVYATYKLRLTAGLLANAASAAIVAPTLTAAQPLSTLLTASGGYVDLDSDGNLWVPSARLLYYPSVAGAASAAQYAAANFYLPQASIDAFGNKASVTYDPHKLLVTSAIDTLSNETKAEYNYRVLSPWLVSDPNLNRRGVRYDELGMVVASASMGKELTGGGDEGDHLDLSTDEPSTGDRPTARLEYNLGSYREWMLEANHNPEHPAPVSVHTLAREQHKDESSLWLETYTYSDGLGRVVLTKIQAEPGPAPARNAAGELIRDAQGQIELQQTSSRWAGSGRVVYDNKGNAVKAYEPFFDSSPAFNDESDLVEVGVTEIRRYDPLSRLTRVDNPDGSFRTVEFDPWQSVAYDEVDTVLESDWYKAREPGSALGAAQIAAAVQAARAANTPAVTDLDTLGRAFRQTANNGAGELYTTLSTLDISGQALATEDALKRVILTQLYDMTGAAINASSVDSGERWMLAAVDGKPLVSWDARGIRVEREYDAARRPTGVFVSEAGASSRQVEQSVYGESLPQAQAKERNLLGALYESRDQAGVATVEQRDYDGNVISSSRQLLRWQAAEVDWSSTPALDPALIFPSSATYDALHRPTTLTAPDGSITAPSYNQRSLLAQLTVRLRGAATATSFITAISYDEKGQRESVSYGNGALTTYTYDPQTFRLTRLQTTRPLTTGQPAGANPLQDLAYTYDPVGNVTNIADAAQQVNFYANQIIQPEANYSYDAIYRLIEASGRELIGNASQPQTTASDALRMNAPLPCDAEAMQNYTESYGYDAVGNLQSLTHTAAKGSWRRTYAYDEPNNPPASNRLSSTTVGGQREGYEYDANGNIIEMPQLSKMVWDYANRLRMSASQLVNAGDTQSTYYAYDQGANRVRKLTSSANGTPQRERIYLDGYELYREYSASGAVVLERESLHVSDGATLVCMVETTTVDASSAATPLPSQAIRYQLTNLLGSSVLELDATAALISYEEYYPYGSTSFQAGRSLAEVSLKRYRFCGKERDEESGLYYHGARYYAPWLGRWVSCDPKGLVDGPALYAYCRCNPVVHTDPQGTQTLEFPQELTDQWAQPTDIKVDMPSPAAAQRSQSAQAPKAEDKQTRANVSAEAAGDINEAIKRVQEEFQPRSPSGEPLFGDLNLYTGPEAHERALAAPGYMLKDTIYFDEAVKAEESLRVELKLGSMDKVPDQVRYDAIWSKTSYLGVRDSSLSGSVVTQNDLATLDPTKIQAVTELPTLQRFGSAMGGVTILGGGLSILSGTQEQDPTLAGMDYAGGTAQVVGGGLTILGSFKPVAPIMATGKFFGTAGALITAPVVLAHAYKDVKSDDPVRQMNGALDAIGTVAPPAAFLSAYNKWFVQPAAELLYNTAKGAISQWYGVPTSWVH